MLHSRHFDPPAPRVRNQRTARAATHRRIVQKSRARYTTIGRVSLVLGVLLIVLMSYVVLTSCMTGLSYAVANAQAEREALQEDSVRLDDRIAALRSDDRLAALAARLGMREPQRFAVVRVPAAPAVAANPQRLAVISSLAGFFMPAVTRQQR